MEVEGARAPVPIAGDATVCNGHTDCEKPVITTDCYAI